MAKKHRRKRAIKKAHIQANLQSGSAKLGKRGRKQEIKERKPQVISAERSEAISSKIKDLQQQLEDFRSGARSDIDITWTQLRRLADQAQRQTAQSYREGAETLQKIEQRLSEYDTPASIYLSNLLKSEISKYGMDNTIRGMANMGADTIERLERILYYVGNLTSEEAHQELVEFAESITGSIMEMGDLRVIGEIAETMENYNVNLPK